MSRKLAPSSYKNVASWFVEARERKSAEEIRNATGNLFPGHRCLQLLVAMQHLVGEIGTRGVVQRSDVENSFRLVFPDLCLGLPDRGIVRVPFD